MTLTKREVALLANSLKRMYTLSVVKVPKTPTELFELKDQHGNLLFAASCDRIAETWRRVAMVPSSENATNDVTFKLNRQTLRICADVLKFNRNFLDTRIIPEYTKRALNSKTPTEVKRYGEYSKRCEEGLVELSTLCAKLEQEVNK